MSVIVLSSSAKVTRQLPVTVMLYSPLRPPFNGCNFQPGNVPTCFKSSANSNTARILLIFATEAAGKPEALSSRYSAFNPLCRNFAIITAHRTPMPYVCQAYFFFFIAEAICLCFSCFFFASLSTTVIITFCWRIESVLLQLQ